MPIFTSKRKAVQKFQKDLGTQEVKRTSFIMFDDEYLGGDKEAEALIKRYSGQTTLTEDEISRLKNNVPPAPKFSLLPKEIYSGKGCYKRHKYRSKMESYYAERKKSYITPVKKKGKNGKLELADSSGQIYARTRFEIEERISRELVQKSQQNNDDLQTDEFNEIKTNDDNLLEEVTTEVQNIEPHYENLIEANEKNVGNETQDIDLGLGAFKHIQDNTQNAEQEKVEDLYEDIPLEAGAIDKAFEKMSSDPILINAENKIGEAEADKAKKNTEGLEEAFKLYSGARYMKINRILRTGKGDVPQEAVTMTEAIKKNPLNRDLVCRRGVMEVYTLGFMLGLKDAALIRPDELKKIVKEKLKSGEPIVIKDKGFMSTGLPFAESPIPSGGYPGIEFMILLKKGTPAMNITSLSTKKDEGEVLVAPGTKFRILKAELDGESAPVSGDQGDWRIWIVSDNSEENETDKKGEEA